ncbi:hypothetical protein QQ045_016633 [Rhodiola kirilowii]
MGELGSIWLYQEDADDLKMKLQSTRLELEAVRHEVNVTKEQTREKEKQLHTLIQIAYKERDEAREQLQNLLNKINTVQPHLMIIPNNKNLPSDDSILFHKQPRANSSISESNTLSDPYNKLNNNSYVSSPVDSIFDAVTSPEFSPLNNLGDDCQNNVGFVSHQSTYDHATVVIDELVKGKALPQKGKLLEAVMEAGPLLQTLMLAGPLPSWRNPPPLQPFKIPQVATGCDHPNVAPMRPSWCSGAPFAEMSCGSSSHIGTNSMLNFSNGGVNNGGLLMNMNSQIPVGKRQRLM